MRSEITAHSLHLEIKKRAVEKLQSVEHLSPSQSADTARVVRGLRPHPRKQVCQKLGHGIPRRNRSSILARWRHLTPNTAANEKLSETHGRGPKGPFPNREYAQHRGQLVSVRTP